MQKCTCDAGVKHRERCRIDGMWSQAGIPSRFLDFRLESSPVFSAVWGYGVEGSHFLWGDVGRGKTGLAVGIARRQLEMGVGSLLFVSVPDLLSELRDTYNSDTSELNIINRYADVPLLILDDLGAEQAKNTEWIEDRLYQVINRRHGEMKPTIITSNLSLRQLSHRIGIRNTERVRELCGDNIIEIRGSNLRD